MASKEFTRLGKAHRVSVTPLALLDLSPDEVTAMRWFESQVWSRGRHRVHCGKVTREVPNAKPMPNGCTICRSYFTVRTGTVLERE